MVRFGLASCAKQRRLIVRVRPAATPSRRLIMGHYLIEVSYTAESWKSQVATQADVIDRISPLVAECKGSIECLYYAFGDRDLVGVLDFPTPEDAAAFALAVTAAGALTSYVTTPLLTVAQGKAAMKKASAAGKRYQPAVGVSLVEQKRPVKSK
jgi:uncharacterized protein with GYD domain